MRSEIKNGSGNKTLYDCDLFALTGGENIGREFQGCRPHFYDTEI